ncbi:MAG TPA: WD40 repeat domain-containing protein [Polyangiaceae bacterium]|nr:WD40 repeat domain-containing protein [Polyangiaceae bacterium]
MPRPNCLLLALVGSVACGSSAGTGSGHGVGAGTPGFGDAGAGVGPSGAGASGTPCLDLDADAFQVSFGKDYLLAANTEGLTLLRADDFSAARTFSMHRGTFSGGALSPDGTRGASIDVDGKLRLFAAADAGQVAIAAFPDSLVRVGFVPDGSKVYVVDLAGVTSLVRWSDGAVLWQTAGAGVGVVNATAVSPDGSEIALCSSTAISFLGTGDGSTRRKLSSGGTALAYAPDGSYLAVASGSSLGVVSPADGRSIGPTIAAGDAIHDLAISPDGSLLAAAADFAHVPVFRRADGTMAHDLKLTAATNPQVQTADAAFLSVAFSPDGSEVAAAEQRLHVWRLADGAPLVQPDALANGMIWGQSLAYKDPYVAYARVGGPAQVWDYTAGRLAALMPLMTNGNQGTVAFDPDDHLLVDFEQITANSSVDLGTLYSVGGTAPVRTITYATMEQPDRAGALVYSPDGRTLAGPGSSKQPGLLRFWSPMDGSATGSVAVFAAAMGPIVWSPDGSLVAVAGADHLDTSTTLMSPTDEAIRIVDFASQKVVSTVTGFGDYISGLAFLPDGRHVVSGDATGLVRVSAVDGGASLDLSHSATLNAPFALSPKGDLVAVRGTLWDKYGHNASIAVLRTADAVEVGHFYNYGDANTGAMAWTPDGTKLVAGAATALHVFCADQMAPPAPVTDGGTAGYDAGTTM